MSFCIIVGVITAVVGIYTVFREGSNVYRLSLLDRRIWIRTCDMATEKIGHLSEPNIDLIFDYMQAVAWTIVGLFLINLGLIIILIGRLG